MTLLTHSNAQQIVKLQRCYRHRHRWRSGKYNFIKLNSKRHWKMDTGLEIDSLEYDLNVHKQLARIIELLTTPKKSSGVTKKYATSKQLC